MSVFYSDSGSFSQLEVSSSLLISGTLVVSGSINTTQNINGTASWANNTISSSYSLTSSYVATSSYAFNADTLNGLNSTVFATTGSNLFKGTQQISGALQLSPTSDPGTSNITSSYLFVTSSADGTEYNLHYRNNGALWEMHWLEETIDSGLIWGGVVTYSGTTIYVTPGAGLTVNHNASTSSHGGTTAAYVPFGPITASATYITSSQVTYLVIDSDGSLIQQTNVFTPQQYNEKFPLGYIFCLTTSSISSYADSRVTSYGQDEQQSQFIRAFGPLKISGFDLTAQSGSLQLSIASGRTYRAGGFYKDNPDNPSIYDSSNVATGSFVRVYRDPAVVGGFKATLNGAIPFTTIDPTKWDDGSGTLQTVSSNQWTIQRIFQGVVNGISYVYYGQNTYDSLASAVQSITTEAFEESQTSILALPFIGYIITRGNTTNLSDTTNNKLINAGLFRNTAGSSGGGGVATTNLNDLADVTITSPSTGQALVYNAGIWVNSVPLNSTSASYAGTASYVENAQTASYVLNAISASYASTASYVVTSQTASYVLNAISASFATTASYVTGSIHTSTNPALSASYASTASYVTTAQTASYVLQAVSASFASTASYVTGSIHTSTNPALSASYASTASYVLQAVSASYATTASYVSRTVSRGGTVYNSNGITENASYIIWRAPSSGTVSKIYAYREGGSSTQINALKNTSLLISANYSIASTGTWLDVGALQNTSIVAGDALYIVVSGSGASPTEISVQIDITQ